MVAVTTIAQRASGTQGDTAEEVGCLDEELSVAVAARDGIAEVVDLAGLVCPEGRCVSDHDGVLVRPDGLHFNAKGEPWVGRWLWEQLLDPARLARHGLRR
jgi:hypothetical protein